MTLIKWKNNNGDLMDRTLFPSVFSDFFDDVMDNRLMGASRNVPAVNISETADDFKVEIAAPGMEKKDFKVEVENGVLSITGEKKTEDEEKNKRYTRREFSYTSFKRTFSLPDHVNGEGINASYHDGILSLTLPKKEEAKPKPAREIEIS